MYTRFTIPAMASVTTWHISEDGYVIPPNEYEQYKERFGWVSKTEIISRIMVLRERTEQGSHSIIAIYEKGHRIKEYLNVERDFMPLHFC